VPRPLLVALLVLALLTPAAAHAGDAPWRPAVGAAAKYAKERRGSVAFSVRTPTRSWGWRAGAVFHSASVLKPMLMLAYLDRPGVRSRALTRADKALLRPMITRSDNATASRILGIVGTRGLRRVARRAGMERFVPVTPIWGHSRTTAADQSRFFLRIEELLPERHRDYAMGLLAGIVPSQRWGIGRVKLGGDWRLYFKGGWGSGTGLVDHQVALLERGDERVAVAIMSARQGTHAYGKETLRGVAARLLRDLPDGGAVP
jgi:hypothetical protein